MYLAREPVLRISVKTSIQGFESIPVDGSKDKLRSQPSLSALRWSLSIFSVREKHNQGTPQTAQLIILSNVAIQPNIFEMFAD